MTDIFFLYGTPNTPEPDVFTGLSNTEKNANAKRWGKAKGYHGVVGGWIYTTDHKPVCQGWSAFFNKKRKLMVADVAAGAFTISRSRKSR